MGGGMVPEHVRFSVQGFSGIGDIIMEEEVLTSL